MAAPTLIYCADGNRRLAQIAIDAGYKYGARLPGTIYHPIYFADQDWKKPDRNAYMSALATHRPYMATVLDLEDTGQLDEVLSWAEDAARYVEVVLIIPKVQGIISKLPRDVGGAEIRLAYSVPTKYGGTELPLWDFYDWPVHLLGGSPNNQMEVARYLDTTSIDGNYHNLKATKFCEYWDDGRWLSITPKQDDAIYEAFRRSCVNIWEAWHETV